MAHLLFVKDRTARNGQEVGDFVLAYDFEPTATEKELFDWVPAPNVSASEVTENIQARLEQDTLAKLLSKYSEAELADMPDDELEKVKPQRQKFPFSKTSLTTKDVEDIESVSVDKTQTIALIDKMALKAPVKDVVEPIAVEK